MPGPLSSASNPQHDCRPLRRTSPCELQATRRWPQHAPVGGQAAPVSSDQVKSTLYTAPDGSWSWTLAGGRCSNDCLRPSKLGEKIAMATRRRRRHKLCQTLAHDTSPSATSPTSSAMMRRTSPSDACETTPAKRDTLPQARHWPNRVIRYRSGWRLHQQSQVRTSRRRRERQLESANGNGTRALGDAYCSRHAFPALAARAEQCACHVGPSPKA